MEHPVRILACAAAFLLLALLVNLTAAFFVTFALVLLLMELDSRTSIILFMVCLAICSLLLAVDRYSGAKTAGAWAYYFLAIGVAVQMVSLVRERRYAGRRGIEDAYEAAMRPSGEHHEE
jgi:uncharacterized YccA/Bax inhibitor family protein